jgi:hypothetical protein
MANMPWDDDEIGRYQLAAICQRGHALTANAELHPAAKFCADCGAAVVTACPGCGAAGGDTADVSIALRTCA